ncbi:hypothetical protein [Bradyrhizobium sp. CCBAU 51753]|uniref:hypothetical protein n=1 Tax=Bradyrhizobium sp. CCBAU 51753 TaxID=1325100 RepID=UPI00188B3980|nr:hypothetical protein [Bradyrhizobium sp. CCBAU 51753]
MAKITAPNKTKTASLSLGELSRGIRALKIAKQGSAHDLPGLDSPPAPNGSAIRRDTMLSSASPKQYLGCDARTHTLV